MFTVCQTVHRNIHKALFPKTSNLNTSIGALLCISLCVLAPDKSSIIFNEWVSPGDTTASSEEVLSQSSSLGYAWVFLFFFFPRKLQERHLKNTPVHLVWIPSHHRRYELKPSCSRRTTAQQLNSCCVQNSKSTKQMPSIDGAATGSLLEGPLVTTKCHQTVKHSHLCLMAPLRILGN